MTWISPEVTPPLCVQSVDRMGRFSYGLPPVDYEMECGGCDRFLPSNNFTNWRNTVVNVRVRWRGAMNFALPTLTQECALPI